jgi:hypothetical protein
MRVDTIISMAAAGKSYGTGVVRASNRYGWDYRRAAEALGPPVVPIIDAHAHLMGAQTCHIYDDVRKAFGVERTYSMTQLRLCEVVRDTLGDSVRFIAFPSFAEPDRYAAFREGYVRTIEAFRRDFGSGMLKLWASPRLRDVIPEIKNQAFGATDVAEVDSHWRIKACEVGQSLGMMFMVHIADPDTWFAAKYTDAKRYGTKRQQYEGLERMLDRFEGPWIAAHMGGWPEDLAFLDGMLTRHPNLHLDTSATKWIVRALGAHPASATRAFFVKWSGRLLFGSDVVVQEDHLRPQKQGQGPMADLADSPESAFDLYASRYWALRTMLETGEELESPIADPDLMMIDPARHTAMSAPTLRGIGLDSELLRVLYRGAAERVVEPYWK